MSDAHFLLDTGSYLSTPDVGLLVTDIEDMQSDPVGATVTYAGDGSPLTIGEGWNGNVLSYTRSDGGTEVLNLTTVGAPPGIIDPDTFWLAPDGREWRAHGIIINVPPTGGGSPNNPDVIIHRSNRLVKRLITGDVQIHRYA